MRYCIINVRYNEMEGYEYGLNGSGDTSKFRMTITTVMHKKLFWDVQSHVLFFNHNFYTFQMFGYL